MADAGIAVLDFGGQYAHLIGRRVREANVFSDIVPCEVVADRLRSYDGVILSGGPASVYDQGAPDMDPEILHMGIPVLGICYGMQLIAHKSGGKVGSAGTKEYGNRRIRPFVRDDIFSGFDEPQETVWMSHGDSVLELPEGYERLAVSDNGLIAAIRNPETRIYGVQFHPEVTHTPKGRVLLRNFVRGICGCEGNWTMEGYIDRTREELRTYIGKKTCVSFASGGVDSTVSTALVAGIKGIGDVHAVYVDNGLMRKGETDIVKQSLQDAGVNLHVVDAADDFVGMLEGVEEPEEKRRLIGDKFAEIAQQQMSSLDPDNVLLVQGTLYTDTIESGHGVGKKAATIKTHHNVGAPMIMALREKGLVVEPNRRIYKDEVRKVGELLGLPEEIVWRHPFPGPGLAVRVICAHEPYYADGYDEDNRTVGWIASDFGFKGCIYPIRTVGVQGDGRTYRNLAILSGPNNWVSMRAATANIVSRVHSVNRVAYLVDGKMPPKKVESVSALGIDNETLDLLREADSVANDGIRDYGLMGKINQMPVILFPGMEKPMVAVRDVVTDDFMTVRPAEKPEEMPWECVYRIAEGLDGMGRFDGFLIDITDKPPATIEWE